MVGNKNIPLEKEETQKNEKVVTSKQKPGAKNSPALEQLIYIGPSIRKNGVVIRTNQTFLGGHPIYYKALYEEYPLIKQLFVPVDKLQESLKKIQKTGTALNAALLSLKGA